MGNLRNRPKDNYIHEIDWKSLYVLTEHWKSDLTFYNLDLKFLHHSIAKYFLWISKKDIIDQVRAIEVNLLETDKKCDSLIKQIDTHLHHLAELIDNPFSYDSHTFRKEHEQIEDDLVLFVKQFRANRKEVFTIKEHIIEGEEMVQRIGLFTS